uniref:Uncharacterized protein n=1 Tax=viral metagenome TaxID=1070528 RepID=A0A6M3X5M4_9ZZZZ
MKKEILDIPEEPIKLKKQLIEMGGDALAIWYGNKLQGYLWNTWKDSLKKKDFTWSRFIKLLKYKTAYASLWLQDKISWENFIQEIIKSIESPLGQNIDCMVI